METRWQVLPSALGKGFLLRYQDSKLWSAVCLETTNRQSMAVFLQARFEEGRECSRASSVCLVLRMLMAHAYNFVRVKEVRVFNVILCVEILR